MRCHAGVGAKHIYLMILALFVMREMLRNYLKKLGEFALEFYLIALIIINLTDLFDMLPGEADIAKKIFSWVVVVHLLATISMSTIFFGERRTWVDRQLIIAFTLLSMQTILAYAVEVIRRFGADPSYLTFTPLVKLLAMISNPAVLISISNWLKYVGFAWLAALAFYCALNVSFSERSVLGVMHEEGPPTRRFLKTTIRFLLVLIVLNAFSLFVFNLLLEWMGWAVDAPLLVVALAYYVFLAVKHYFLTGRGYNLIEFLEQVENFSESFAKRFVELFHDRQTFYIGFVGLLVFHILTDIGTFLIPYVTGLERQLYGSLHEVVGHSPLFVGEGALLVRDAATLSLPDLGLLLSVYILNVIAILSFMLAPVYLWYCLYTGTRIRWGTTFVVLFGISCTVFLITPTFNLAPMAASAAHGDIMMGVDMTTHSIFESGRSVITSLAIGLFVGIILLLLSLHGSTRAVASRAVLVTLMTLFAFYTAYYFISIYHFSMLQISSVISQGSHYMTAIVFTYFFLTFILYICGYILFAYLLWRKGAFTSAA
jgi:hypothetical protein